MLINLAFPLTDRFCIRFPWNILKIDCFECFIYSRNLNVKNCQNFLPTDRQTDRQTDRPRRVGIEAPSPELKKKTNMSKKVLGVNVFNKYILPMSPLPLHSRLLPPILPPLSSAPPPPFLVVLLLLILFHLLLILLFLPLFLLLIIIREGEAKASPHEKGLGASEKSYLLVPILQLHFLATASSNESSLTFSYFL